MALTWAEQFNCHLCLVPILQKQPLTPKPMLRFTFPHVYTDASTMDRN